MKYIDEKVSSRAVRPLIWLIIGVSLKITKLRSPLYYQFIPKTAVSFYRNWQIGWLPRSSANDPLGLAANTKQAVENQGFVI